MRSILLLLGIPPPLVILTGLFSHFYPNEKGPSSGFAYGPSLLSSSIQNRSEYISSDCLRQFDFESAGAH
jgi:hypothetical protein